MVDGICRGMPSWLNMSPSGVSATYITGAQQIDHHDQPSCANAEADEAYRYRQEHHCRSRSHGFAGEFHGFQSHIDAFAHECDDADIDCSQNLR